VLVVDDNEDMAQTLALLLRLKGCEVEVAHDGAQTLLRLRTFSPEVVLLDLGLPGELDGFAVARRIKADPALTDVPLIALSGQVEPGVGHRTHEAGFNAHLTKPIGFEELNQVFDGLGQ
jgi:CheY-like chemotaxis protein